MLWASPCALLMLGGGIVMHGFRFGRRFLVRLWCMQLMRFISSVTIQDMFGRHLSWKTPSKTSDVEIPQMGLCFVLSIRTWVFQSQCIQCILLCTCISSFSCPFDVSGGALCICKIILYCTFCFINLGLITHMGPGVSSPLLVHLAQALWRLFSTKLVSCANL